MKAQSKAIFASLVVLVLAVCTVSGATYSWFSDTENTEIKVSTGKVDISVSWDGRNYTDSEKGLVSEDLSVVGLAPGFDRNFTYYVKSDSTADVVVRTYVTLTNSNSDSNLSGASPFKVKLGDSDEVSLSIDSKVAVSGWNKLANGVVMEYPVSVSMVDAEDNNVWKGLGFILKVETIAYQGNASLPWDGTADTTWYNDDDTTFTLIGSEQLAGLSQLVDGGNDFAGKTIKMGSNMDLYYLPDGATEPKTFNPIGDPKYAFEGTFDGDGYSIDNIYQSGWALGHEWGKYGSLGLFGQLNNAIVKNVAIKGAESFVEGGDVSFIAGSATGDCAFENITIRDSTIATYNNGCGGIIGWSGAGTYYFKNITLGEDVVLGGLWGSFDSSIGGIVGQAEPGATYNFENVEINCRIDAYNDCTASYDYYNYRMCGMIIGRCEKTTTIDGINYPDTSQYNITCNNVTVNYGDWMNYHYCEPTPGHNNGRGMRVEPGYAYDGLPADFDHSQCVTNHMNLIPFDQLIGGDQYGVRGLKTYDGVTVNYPD